MGYSDPYSGLFTAVMARLVHATGPFTESDQVKLWVEQALDDIQPSEELKRELNRDVPIALVCDGGNAPGDDDSDGTTETQTIRVWFCSKAPTIAAALTGDGDEYWGQCALKDWVQKRMMDRGWTVSGWDGMQWRGTEFVSAASEGQAMGVATFTTQRLRTT